MRSERSRSRRDTPSFHWPQNQLSLLGDTNHRRRHASSRAVRTGPSSAPQPPRPGGPRPSPRARRLGGPWFSWKTLEEGSRGDRGGQGLQGVLDLRRIERHPSKNTHLLDPVFRCWRAEAGNPVVGRRCVRLSKALVESRATTYILGGQLLRIASNSLGQHQIGQVSRNIFKDLLYCAHFLVRASLSIKQTSFPRTGFQIHNSEHSAGLSLRRCGSPRTRKRMEKTLRHG